MNTILVILDAVVNSLWQAVTVAALVWAALRFVLRINAATRHAIWWATLCVVLVLPVAPRLFVMLRPNPQPVAARAVNAPKLLAPPVTADSVIVRVAPDRTAKWPLAILAVWAAILLWRMVQIGRSYVYLRGVKRRATVSPIALPVVPRRANLLISRDVVSPMAVGFLRPAVILPESLPGELSEPELQHVLLHETAHLAGYDDWSNLAMRILGAVLALHPVAIWILQRIEREREMACDDWVVARTSAARPYAATLARLFELRQSPRSEILASGIFGRSSRIGDRIEMLLRRGRTFSPRASATGVVASTLVLSGLMLAGSLAPHWIAFAQQPARPSFEVASIKPGDPNSRQVSVGFRPGGRFTTINASLQTLIGFAYDVRNHQIAGGPNWLDSAKFNIEARADSAIPIPPGPAGAPRMRLMVRSLLAERFKLAVHPETREEQVYELVVGKGGSKLKDATHAGPDKPNGLRMGRGELQGMAAPMSLLANQLSQRLGRSVINKTGLIGKYDFTLKWAPDPGGPGGPPEGPDAPPPPDPSGRSIFTAVQEDLGLRLQSAKGPVEIIVIDRAEKPDAN